MGLNALDKMGRYLFAVFLFLILFPLKLQGAWVGPTDVVVGSWGSEVGQFEVEHGDTVDVFPSEIGVDKNGFILIADLVNKRVQIFKSDGSIYRVINKPSDVNVMMWPRSLRVLPNGDSFLGNLYIYNYSGDIVSKINISKSERFSIQDFFLIKNLDNNIYYHYSPNGQIIKTSSTKPLELGIVKEQKFGPQQYKVTITYPDKVYPLLLDGPYEKYTRDSKQNVYAISGKSIKKFNVCGKELGSLDTPENQSTVVRPGGDGFDRITQLIVEYGQPVVAPNGDVYTWKRTPDKYSILKWTWVDDQSVPTGPDAPSGLAVTPSIDGLYLTWTASPNDPGCVTKYEIARATTSDGVFSTVGTVEKGILKYNDTSAEVGTQYYYKVRAMAGSDPSLYTGEASGKR